MYRHVSCNVKFAAQHSLNLPRPLNISNGNVIKYNVQCEK